MLSSRLRMPFRGFNAFWIITISAVAVTLWSGSIATVYGAPAKLDSNETPFPLELQPPLVDDEAAAANYAADAAFNSKPSAFDSYGDPIDALKPIDTPDGRKVVNAQGLQFEIPTYASGITEIKKPADDLLPPFIDPIAVAVPNESAEVLPTGTGTGIPTTVANSISSRETTTVDVENAELVEITADGAEQEGGQPQSNQQQQQQQESVHSPNIVEVGKGRSNEIPAYLLDLNDPDIGGPLEYMPNDEGSLKVIAWDLLPPHNTEPFIVTKENNQPKRVQGIVDPQTNNIKVSLSSGQGLPVNNIRSGSVTEGKVSTVELNNQISTKRPEDTQTTHSDSQTSPSTNSGSGERIQFSLGTRTGAGLQQTASSDVNGQSGENVDTTTRYNQRQRGNVHYSSTTPRSTTARTTRPTTTTTTTTTTRRPTTTTTRRTTTTTTTRAPTTAAPTTTTTAEPLDPSTFYRLAEGDSYVLPSWLADIDDPDLDAAVTFVVPEDLNEYNHTIDRDLLPPFEPFIDLDNIHLPEPTEQKTTVVPTTTSRTTTTRRTTTTTTTRRPTVSTARPNWVRAQPTTTTPRSTTFNSRFTSNHIAPLHAQTIASSSNTFTNSKSSTHASNANTRTSTSTTTTPTTYNNNSFNKKTTYTNAFNQNLPTTTVDPITSSEAAEAAGVTPQKPANPFLTKPHNDGKYNPQPFHRNSGRPITTTTTTTTPSPIIEENPFNSATVPDWLSSFDYPDVGPGVPFVYDPNDPELAVFNDLLPPSSEDAQATDSAKPVFITSSPASFNSFQTPKTTSNSFATSSATTSPSTITANTNFQPSKVTLPLPSIQANRNQNENAVTQPPIVFIPPPPTAAEDYNSNNDNDNNNYNQYNNNHNNNQNSGPVKNFSSSSFNKNFAAPFEPTGSEAGPTTPPIAAEQEAFPPFGGSGGATPSKTTFTKSDDGKVITNNVFQSTSTGGGQQPQQQSAKPFGFGNTFGTQQKDFQASQTNQFFTSTTGFSSSASNSVQGSTGFSTGSGFSSGAGAGFIKTSTPTSFSTFSNVQQASTFGANNGFGKGSATGSVTGAGGGRYTGSFGGAPGVLGSGKVGYAVQTDGSIRDPDHTYRPQTGNGATAAASVPVPAPTQPPKPVAPSFTGFGNRVGGSFTPVVGGGNGGASNANKYRGRFGGPPGILVPYDNVKGGQS